MRFLNFAVLGNGKEWSSSFDLSKGVRSFGRKPGLGEQNVGILRLWLPAVEMDWALAYAAGSGRSENTSKEQLDANMGH